MQRILTLLLACALGLSLLSGCSPGEDAHLLSSQPPPAYPPSSPYPCAEKLSVTPRNSDQVSQALASFGLELLQKTRDTEKQSTLISPLSVALSLSMAANGAEGNTLTQFREVLGGSADLEELNEACAKFMLDYQGLLGSSQCRIANSLWKDNNGGIGQDFVSKCRSYYSAQVYEAELSHPRIVDDLNRWVSDKTNNMIPKIIDQPFPEETACLLVNALYLKNKWLNEFNPLSTHERDFHPDSGSISRIDFLSKYNTELPYIQSEEVQGVVLPYDDGRLAFFTLLPNLYPDSPNLGEWLSSLEGDDLTQLIASRNDTLFLNFAMPKFTAEWNGDLTGILPGMGLEDAFVNGVANFSNLGDKPEGYFISQVIHATKIEVNEKGTEAAAATVVAPAGGAPPQEGITLILDRPFLYGIVDLQTGVPLFLGTYE